jgi:hypothetical protein
MTPQRVPLAGRPEMPANRRDRGTALAGRIE